MTRTRTLIAAAVGGLAALLLVGSALAHPGGGLVSKVDVIARALGISAGEVEQARADGTLKALLADVSKDDLRAAYQSEATEAIDDAETAGDITAGQAASLRDRVAAERTALTRDQRSELRSLRGVVEVDVAAVYASVLGVTSAEVEAAKADGTLRELLAGANRVALAAALLDAREAAIDAAEAAGDITAEQAGLLREAGTGFGGCKGKGHHGGRGGWNKGSGWDGHDRPGKHGAKPIGDPA